MRKWTEEETQYLEEHWGRASVKSIANYLGRTETAVIVKKNNLGLGKFTEAGDLITFIQLLQALGYDSSYTYKQKSWIENRGFPIKNKIRHRCRIKMVNLDDFWKWAEKNQTFLDFSKFEEYALGAEPKWVKEKRKRDIANSMNVRKTPWEKVEDEKLKYLLKKQKYSYMELSQMLNRTVGAIQRRINDLGIMDRPIKADNHTSYTQEEIEKIEQMLDDGCSYQYMSECIGRSAKAISGFVYRRYHTENLDKARARKREMVC